MKTARLYTKADCHLCDEAKVILITAAAHSPFEVQEVNIDQDPVLHKLFGDHVPVLDLDSQRLYWPFGVDDVLEMLDGTYHPGQPAEPGEGPARPAVSGFTRELVIAIDKLIYHFARHWTLVMGLFLGLYAGLPVLAPFLLANGVTGPANLLYLAYRFTCHQLPSRSFFVFGQQVAYCHRDTAIYTTLFLAIIVFALLRERIKPLPWQAYVIFVAPMAIDGVTQIMGLRTSTWQLRTLTGVLFGVGSAWLAFPYLEQSFQDIRQSVNRQLHLEPIPPDQLP